MSTNADVAMRVANKFIFTNERLRMAFELRCTTLDEVKFTIIGGQY